MTGNDTRPFHPDDLDAVLDLRARCFEGLDPLRERIRWRWEFEENPFRNQNVPATWVVERDGTIVGNYGMLPLPMSVGGARKLSLCGMDFCVDPKRRRFGLGLLLTRRFLDTPGCAFPFVTSPTPAATRLMRYFGASVLVGKDEPCLWVSTGGSPPRAAAAAAPRVERIDGFDEGFDALFERVARHHRLLTFRDHRYLNWRYRDYPFGRPVLTVARGDDGVPRGFSVYQEDSALERAYLLELFAEPPDAPAITALVADALEQHRASSFGELYVLHRVQTVHAALREAGFLPVEGHPLTFPCRLPPGGFSLADWYLTSGDGDILFGVGGP